MDNNKSRNKPASFFDWLDEKIQWTYWLYIVLAVFVSYEVICRYVFKNPHDWFLEVAIAMSVFSGFLGGGMITKERRHIILDIFYVNASPKRKRMMDIINSVAGIVFSGILGFYVIKHMLFLNRIDSRYETSLALPYSVQTSAAALGLILCLLFFIQQLIHAIKQK